MTGTKRRRDDTEMPGEIDFRGGERGRYTKRFAAVGRIVVLKKKPRRRKT